jgi:hypothetical protein
MGVQIVAKGVDAEQYASEYSPPVKRGLEGIFFTNTSLEKCGRNYAPDKLPGIVIGAPKTFAGYASLVGMTSYIQTQINETIDLTMLVIGRCTVVPGNADTTPMLCGSYDAIAPAGVSIYSGAVDRVTGTAAFGDDDASSTNSSAIVTPITLGAWGLYSVAVSNAGITARSHTGNVVITRAATKLRRPSGRKIRIGSGYTTAQKGPVDIAMFQHYSVVLTDDELTKTVADMRAYALRKGIVV